MYMQSVEVARMGFGILPNNWETRLMPGDLFYDEVQSRWCDISPSMYGDWTSQHPTTVFRRRPASVTLAPAWTPEDQAKWASDNA